MRVRFFATMAAVIAANIVNATSVDSEDLLDKMQYDPLSLAEAHSFADVPAYSEADTEADIDSDSDAWVDVDSDSDAEEDSLA